MIASFAGLEVLAAWLVVAVLGVAACADTTTGCRTDADCPSGTCANGSCMAVGNPMKDLGGVDGSGGHEDAGVQDFGGSHGDGAAPLCTFNGDGVLQRSEAPFLVGLGALFAVNPPSSTVTVDLQAHNGVWDFSAATSGEQKVFDQLVDPAGQWWAKDFPTATHAEKIDDGQDLYGVYRATDTALELLGIVSATSGVTQTELTYATPVDVLRFPLAKGDGWSTTSTVSGLASGVLVAASDTYQFAVDARGTTVVPAGSFDTLRLRIAWQETIGLLVTTRFTELHLAECYGAVARIRSRDDETSPDFTQATEYRRLATQ